MIDELRHPDYNIVRDTTLDVFSALTATHWWDHETDMLNAVHPDPIGAAFVDRVWSLVPRAVSAKVERCDYWGSELMRQKGRVTARLSRLIG